MTTFLTNWLLAFAQLFIKDWNNCVVMVKGKQHVMEDKIFKDMLMLHVRYIQLYWENVELLKWVSTLITCLEHACIWQTFCIDSRASIHLAVRCLTAKSREVSKPRDWVFWLSHRSEIWQAPRQRCCRGACQISERLEKSKHEYCNLETSRDLAVRRLTA